MTMQIVTVAKAKTATIVSPTQLAINAGGDQGIQLGDAVIVRKTVTVTDPDSRAQLGVVHLTRLRLAVTTVADSFAVGTVTDEIPSNIFSALDLSRSSRLKTIVGYESEATDASVFVQPGEPVIVTRRVDDGEGEAK